MTSSPSEFVLAHTADVRPPLVPEIVLRGATEVTPLWHATEAWLVAHGVAPPYWAFAWAGGQALARYLLDGAAVRGKTVLDVGCGSGLVAIAAAKAGASHVRAVDLDPLAVAATRLAAELNDVTVDVHEGDVTELTADADVVTIGDLFYESDTARAVVAWSRKQRSRVLAGDPGRHYVPVEDVRELARYEVPTPEELEGAPSRIGRVLELV